MENKLLQALIKETYTVAELKSRIRILKLYFMHSLYKENTDISQSYSDERWLQAFLKTNTSLVNEVSRSNSREILSAFDTYLVSIQPLTLFVPIQLPPEEEAELVNRLRSEYTSDLFVDLKVNPTIIAGCSLIYKGHFKDYTFHADFQKKKVQIAELVKEYTKSKNKN